MVSFQCEDCGENLKKPNLKKHFSMCSATKEKYGPKRPSIPKENSKREIDFDINAALFCCLCNAKTNCEKNFVAHVRGKKHREKAKGFDAEQSAVYKDNSNNLPDFEKTLGLSKQHPWFCSLCNIKATCKQNLLSHANGNKHRANVKQFNTKQAQRQAEHSTVNKKDNSKQRTEIDINVGLSVRYPWFCSLCNATATSQLCLLSHANGKKHRENVEQFNANQLQQSEQSMTEKKDTIENASKGDSEQKKVDLPISSGVANGCYSQPDKKRKLETFNGNKEVVQAEVAEEGVEKKRESKKAKKQDYEKKGKKKQTESDSDFEYDKEDMKLQLVSYSKEELIYLIYKTVEKGSRLMSTILESTEHDISQRNIVVHGFGWDTTHEYLKAAFESYGEIADCSVVMDKDTGRSKGYGFVLFKTRKGAREALKNPEKKMYNRTVVCNLASENPCEPAFPGIEQTHGHVLEKRHQQSTMDMFGQNMPFYGHSQRPGFDPMYGPLRGNQMVTGLGNYRMFGSSLVNQGFVAPSNHVGMAGQYFGYPERRS